MVAGSAAAFDDPERTVNHVPIPREVWSTPEAKFIERSQHLAGLVVRQNAVLTRYLLAIDRAGELNRGHLPRVAVLAHSNHRRAGESETDDGHVL